MKKKSDKKVLSEPSARKLGMYKPAETKSALIASLQNGCTVTSACLAANIQRSTFYAWRNEDKSFNAKVEETRVNLVGIAEDSLLANVEYGKEASVFFALCNWAPDKYRHVNKIEHSGKIDDGSSELKEVSVETLKAIRVLLENANTELKKN